LLAEAFAERLRPALKKLSEEAGEPVPVLSTAHSVPSRTVQASASGEGQADSYVEDAKATAAAVAARVPEIGRWEFAFQSQGASGGPWIGPSVEETLEEFARQGVKNLVLQPIGFLCDHVEILYDVDCLFKEYAAQRGIRLERPESLNASPKLARAVAGLATESLRRLRA
jgi:ferrochelatase